MQDTEANSIVQPKIYSIAFLLCSNALHVQERISEEHHPTTPTSIKETKIQACFLKLFFILQKSRSHIRVTAAHSPLYSKKDKE